MPDRPGQDQSRPGASSTLSDAAGATADHTAWSRLLPFLEPHVSVLAVDLLGHSFGGAISLGAATLTPNVRKLALYEPVTRAEHDAKPAGVVERIDRLVREGKREEALETMFREIVLMSEETLAAYRRLPIWPARVAAVHTSVRELSVPFADTGVAPERARSVTVPTLLLVGSESPPYVQRGVTSLAAVMPNAQVSVLQGQEHMAMYEAPEAFARRVLAFLEASDR